MLFIWIGFAVVTAFAAQARGRSFWGWLAIGALTGVFGLIAVLVMAPVSADAGGHPDSSPYPSRHIDDATAPLRRRGPVNTNVRDVDLPRNRARAYGGFYGQEVVGESHYAKALHQLMRGQPAPDDGQRVTAVLAPDPDNRFDRNAVRVLIGGLHVGHLPKEVSPDWLDALEDAGCPGETAQVPAKIYSGRDDRPGAPLRYGVWLDMDPDFEVLP